MDFLDNLVLPQSAHHMILLKYLLVLTNIILIPYLSVLFGSLSLSIYFENKGSKNQDNKFYRFAKELIDQITFNKSVSFAFGIVPLLSAAFCYAQLLHNTGLNVPEYILVSASLLVIAFIFVYTYKVLFIRGEMFVEREKQIGKKRFNVLHVIVGLSGIVLLVLSVYLFIASIQLAGDVNNWSSNNNLIGIIFSVKALIYFVQFVVASFAFTATWILYKYFKSEAKLNYDKEYLGLVKKYSLRIGLVATILLPLLVVLTVIVKPEESFSYNVFGFALLALIGLLCILILFYVMLKESNTKFVSMLIYLFVVVFVFMIIKDQYAFDTSTKKQFAILSANYEEYQAKIKEEFGLVTEVINGADIYNGKCIACHQFDKKLVGPPYNETLPKYVGKKVALVQFILNPIKVNPEYPPMPNQGLKPKEAEAVADYILNTYKK
jgi:cytochrome c